MADPPKDPHCKYVDLKNTTKYALAGQEKPVEVLGMNGCSKSCKCNKKIVKSGFLGLGRKTIGDLVCSSCKGGRCHYVDADGSIKSVTTGMSYNDSCNTCKCLESGGACTKKVCQLTCSYMDWNGLNKYIQAGQNMSLKVLGEKGCLKKCTCVKKFVKAGFLGFGRKEIAQLNCEERCYTKGNKGDKRKKRKEKRKEERKKRKGKKRKGKKRKGKKRKGKKRKGKKAKGDQKKD